MPDEAVSGAEGSPAATADGVALVEALPGELDAGSAISRALARIERGVDGAGHFSESVGA